jgi:type-F conjugative transfer system pilin assembly protein TrbC
VRYSGFEKRGLSRDPNSKQILFKAVGLGIGLIIALMIARDAFASTRRAFIDAPNSCHRVNKIEKDTVFLESTAKTCAQGIGKISVEIDSFVKTVRIHVDGGFWKEQALVELNMGEVGKIAKRAQERAKHLKVPKNRYRKEMEDKAGNLAEAFHSQASQEKLAAETERIKTLLKKQIEGPSIKSGQEDPAGASRGSQPVGWYLRSSERIYLFVSSSVPMTTLRNYAVDLARLADPNMSMVMRGMIGGMKTVRPTTEFVSRVIVKDTNCKVFQERCDAYQVNFMIDPLLFRKYRITQVPALVYVPRTNVIERDRSEGLTEAEGEFYVLYGDASLEYLLETLRRETKSRSLQKAAAALSHQESPQEKER